ncbi:probable beta-1,4-xylosyltransferase IRX9H [Vicia villosa]|uniref:probable beta-1,4-xylosyltransferase IRX9H n=1 Tax=Vicia villosa TaxID=3911 RepID=UPI00273B550D|nr:probable beta-1,4-xylosyltransferase IRX9H [Vicia villosa]
MVRDDCDKYISYFSVIAINSFICFMVGVSIGLIPLASTNLSSKFMANHQGFSSEVISEVENLKINKTPLVDEDVKFDATLISPLQEQELTNGVSYNILDSQFNEESYSESQKLLIVITPTYNRLFQAYYLHRLSQTLKLVQPLLLWVVVEMNSQSEETSYILRNSGIMYRHLVCKMNLTNTSHKSILMRNVAIAHIETHRLDGIVYFADDDNVYSIELFQKMRDIRRFGTWTIAKLSEDRSGIVFQGPICNGSEVIGWHTSNESDRKSKRFHAEISGFAFNSTILWERKKWHRPLLERIRQLESVNENLWVIERNKRCNRHFIVDVSGFSETAPAASTRDMISYAGLNS